MIGILPTVEYQEHKLKLEPGDTLVIYSDGVTEAADPHSEEFEVERLAEVVSKSRHLPSARIVTDVNRAVAEFTSGAPQSDDITLIIARRIGL